jgi:hypothetical protein
VCEQPQQGARDIWTQIYPIGHTGDRRREIVPKWLLNAANQQNVAALPRAVRRFWIGVRLPRRRRAPEDAAAIPLVCSTTRRKRGRS